MRSRYGRVCLKCFSLFLRPERVKTPFHNIIYFATSSTEKSSTKYTMAEDRPSWRPDDEEDEEEEVDDTVSNDDIVSLT